MAQPYKKRRSDGSQKPSPMLIDGPRYKRRYVPRGVSSTESKFFDTTLASTSMDSTGTVLSTSLNLVNEGNGTNEMAGRKIVVTKVMVHLSIEAPNNSGAITAVETGPEFRFIVILDKQCNGASATVANYLSSTAIRSFNNLSNGARFKTLKDIRGCIEQPMAFNSNTLVYGAGPIRKTYDFYIPANLLINFSDQAGGTRVIGEILSNNLLVIGFSSTGAVKAAYTIRIRFKDG